MKIVIFYENFNEKYVKKKSSNVKSKIIFID